VLDSFNSKWNLRLCTKNYSLYITAMLPETIFYSCFLVCTDVVYYETINGFIHRKNLETPKIAICQ